MDWKETEKMTTVVMARMEDSLNSLEQMSFDSINITDKLVNGINDIRDELALLKSCKEEDRAGVIAKIERLLQEHLVIAFEVNNVSHDLETQTSYQRGTMEDIKQIVEFLYAMQ